MKVKNTNKAIWLIESQFDCRPATSCSFWRLFILAIITIPFTWPSMVVNMINDFVPYFRKKVFLPKLHGGFGLIFVILPLALSPSIYERFFHKQLSWTDSLIWSPVSTLIAMLFIVVCLMALYWIVVGLILAYERIEERQRARQLNMTPDQLEEEMKPKQPSAIVSAYRAFKEKHCSKIEYID